jgi:hypothetical protein
LVEEKRGKTFELIIFIKSLLMPKSPFKSTFLLFGAFLILLLIVFFYASDGARESSQRNEVEQSYLSLSVIESMDRLEISNTTELVSSFSIDDGVWSLEGRSIDKGLQDDVIGELLGIPTGRSVSRNTENWSEYGLDQSFASIVLYQGEEILSTLRFGKQTAGPGGLYMRRDDDEAVYKVATSLQQYQYYDTDQWMSKDLIFGNINELASFTARVGDERWSFEMKDGSWFLKTDTTTTPVENGESVTTYLETLFGLNATGFEHDLSVLTETEQALSLQFNDGSEYIVSVDVQEEGKTYAQVTNGYDLFTLSSDLEAHLRPSFLDLEQSPEDETVSE